MVFRSLILAFAVPLFVIGGFSPSLSPMVSKAMLAIAGVILALEIHLLRRDINSIQAKAQ